MIIDANPETRTRRYRGVSYTKPIDAAKEVVPVIDLADRLTGPGSLRRVGKEWVGRCPLPDHEDRSPSFTVNADKGVFFCHGCLRGGDVVELARLAWGYDEIEAHVAAAYLLMEFGFEVPQRPPAWFARQARQKPVRDALEDAKVRSAQRRLMRRLEPYLARIEDDAERRAEAFAVWEELEIPARMIVGGAS
ncbi:MAG: CHC2 zinc finger domain-containing protein [Actinomycetota bacterium]|nr:CHC2 zinc finger domain-containing protein [Actinomycetota bacterium]